MNWESILIAAIGPVLVIVGLIYQEYRKRKLAQDANAADSIARKEPTWVELEEANRDLRTEMDDLRDRSEKRIKALEERFAAFERKTNTRIGALSNMLHSASSQWPADSPGPYFDLADLEALENTDVPYVWRNRVRPSG